jgi:hypothetical protein
MQVVGVGCMGIVRMKAGGQKPIDMLDGVLLGMGADLKGLVVILACDVDLPERSFSPLTRRAGCAVCWE